MEATPIILTPEERTEREIERRVRPPGIFGIGSVLCVVELSIRRLGMGEDCAAGVGDGLVGSRSGLRTRILNLAKTCSIGLSSGEYFGGSTGRTPTSGIAFRVALLLWDVRLSRSITSPGLRGRDEGLLDVAAKALAIDRSIAQAGSVNPILAERR